MIPAVVYTVCAVTSILCAALLLRGYRRSKTRILFWSAVCFGGLAVNNIVLCIDLIVTGPEIDLSLLRSAMATSCALGFLLALIAEET